jgi:hypothetical protein
MSDSPCYHQLRLDLAFRRGWTPPLRQLAPAIVERLPPSPGAKGILTPPRGGRWPDCSIPRQIERCRGPTGRCLICQYYGQGQHGCADREGPVVHSEKREVWMALEINRSQVVVATMPINLMRDPKCKLAVRALVRSRLLLWIRRPKPYEQELQTHCRNYSPVLARDYGWKEQFRMADAK